MAKPVALAAALFASFVSVDAGGTSADLDKYYFSPRKVMDDMHGSKSLGFGYNQKEWADATPITNCIHTFENEENLSRCFNRFEGEMAQGGKCVQCIGDNLDAGCRIVLDECGKWSSVTNNQLVKPNIPNNTEGLKMWVFQMHAYEGRWACHASLGDTVKDLAFGLVCDKLPQDGCRDHGCLLGWHWHWHKAEALTSTSRGDRKNRTFTPWGLKSVMHTVDQHAPKRPATNCVDNWCPLDGVAVHEGLSVGTPICRTNIKELRKCITACNDNLKCQSFNYHQNGTCCLKSKIQSASEPTLGGAGFVTYYYDARPPLARKWLPLNCSSSDPFGCVAVNEGPKFFPDACIHDRGTQDTGRTNCEKACDNQNLLCHSFAYHPYGHCCLKSQVQNASVPSIGGTGYTTYYYQTNGLGQSVNFSSSGKSMGFIVV